MRKNLIGVIVAVPLVLLVACGSGCKPDAGTSRAEGPFKTDRFEQRHMTQPGPATEEPTDGPVSDQANHPGTDPVEVRIDNRSDKHDNALTVTSPRSGETPTTERACFSRTWHILRHGQPALLVRLPVKLANDFMPVRRTELMRTGVDDGGSVKLDIAVEDDATGDILLGFFTDAAWSAEPAQVRIFPGPGEYILHNLPPGTFHVGAMIGSPEQLTALGVHRSWPEPIEIKAGQTTAVQVLLSPEFSHLVQHQSAAIARGLGRNPEEMNQNNLLQGRVSGPNGQPVPYVTVQIRQHNPGAQSFAMPSTVTDEMGNYYFDEMKWPYTVAALWDEALPAVLGSRHQYMHLNHVFRGSQTVDFQFELFPEGTAKLTGRVVDQYGEAVEEFSLTVSTTNDWNDQKTNYDRRASYRIPVVTTDGSFTLNGLPSGVFTVRAVPFETQAYEISFPRPEVTLENGKTADITIEVRRKNLYYGRVLFVDAMPPWPGTTICLIRQLGPRHMGFTIDARVPLDEEGYFALPLSDKELAQLRSGMRQLQLECPVRGGKGKSRTVGEFPVDLLSRERDKAGMLKGVTRPSRTRR